MAALERRRKSVVYVIGNNSLQNRLLAGLIREHTGLECQCRPDLNPLTLADAKRLPRCLLLIDGGAEEDLIKVCSGSKVAMGIRKPGFCLAFFNVVRNGGFERDLLRRGIRGVFYDTDPPELLAKGAQAILKGELWYPRMVLSRCLLSEMGTAGEDSADLSILTPREHEIILMIAAGDRNQEIADHLCISLYTVKTHTSRIFKKIKVSSRLQAAFWAAKYLDS